MNETVLITGGAGFIGRHVGKMLRSRGFDLRILDSLAPQVHGAVPQGLQWLASDEIEFVRGSVNERRDIEAALDGVDHVVHLAAETGTGQSMYEVARYCRVNVQGTATLLDVLANSKSRDVKRIVLASSRSVYGEGAYACKRCGEVGERQFPAPRTAQQLASHRWEPLCFRCGGALAALPTRETDPVRPASIYAATKYAQEDLIRVACESLGLGYAILRLQNVYGEGQSLQNPYTGILSIFSTRLRRHAQLTAFEDGLESRDFVHVEDVARAIVVCLTAATPINQIVNVGSGIATTVLDVAAKLSLALGTKPRLTVTGAYRVGDIRHNFADVERLRAELSCVPQVSLDEGLNRFAKWVATQPLHEDRLDKANSELRARNLMG